MCVCVCVWGGGGGGVGEAQQHVCSSTSYDVAVFSTGN